MYAYFDILQSFEETATQTSASKGAPLKMEATRAFET